MSSTTTLHVQKTNTTWNKTESAWSRHERGGDSRTAFSSLCADGKQSPWSFPNFHRISSVGRGRNFPDLMTPFVAFPRRRCVLDDHWTDPVGEKREEPPSGFNRSGQGKGAKVKRIEHHTRTHKGIWGKFGNTENAATCANKNEASGQNL